MFTTWTYAVSWTKWTIEHITKPDPYRSLTPAQICELSRADKKHVQNCGGETSYEAVSRQRETRYEDDIKMDSREIYCLRMEMAQDSVRRRVLLAAASAISERANITAMATSDNVPPSLLLQEQSKLIKYRVTLQIRKLYIPHSLPKCYHLDVVRGPSTPHDPESDAGGSLSSWQGHPSR
jgi:hypothetical protein